MTRRERPTWLRFTRLWWKPHRGRFWKRRLAKAERAYARGRTRERTVAHLRSTVSWKDW